MTALSAHGGGVGVETGTLSHTGLMIVTLVPFHSVKIWHPRAQRRKANGHTQPLMRIQRKHMLKMTCWTDTCLGHRMFGRDWARWDHTDTLAPILVRVYATLV
jgi:hypothetical protein